MTPSITDLEDQIVEVVREARLKNTDKLTAVVKALPSIVETVNTPEQLALLYAQWPLTLDQMTDDGGIISHLIRRNLELHLIEWVEEWLSIKQETEI
jgi:hypothetical protein